jgi:transposase
VAATGRPRADDRRIINGMAHKIRTGITWRDLPARYGPWQTVYTRFRRYALAGVFLQALQHLQARADAAGGIDWLVQIDSTIVRAHQHAAPTGRKGGKRHQKQPDDHALGRSRGGLTTELHLAADGRGRPLAILLSPGHRNDSVCARPLLERIRVPCPGPGRPRCRPGHLVADKAYSSRGFRAYLRQARMVYEHPVYTPESVAAQHELPALNERTMAYAGAYHGWGLHEDGCRSGVAAAEALGVRW